MSTRVPGQPVAWIPGESDFVNARYMSRPAWWPTMTPDEARAGRLVPMRRERGADAMTAIQTTDAGYSIS